ncbi:hypothetical protein SYJ56_22995 [Algoriphagus sp. D3-2-R+10]|uniref:hypothetical protein n=1 Tax=Algoriphagus aurantiacus TaxID=3103948 RepID=UPI002B3C216B|nr:hypothetical protein [Algoriphagus sp. D3-2-R+10]MEB2778196.1 hypothetical protein [Algoriphagus sp. D3-2-R+10]
MALRECTSSDYPKLVEFWNLNAGWDVINEELWKERFLSSPIGNSFVVIVENDGNIQAQLIFVSLSVSLGKEVFFGSRPYAAVIAKRSTGLSGYKYIIQLYNFGIQLLKKKKFDLVIMLPDPRWKRLASFFDIHIFSFPLFKLSLSTDMKFDDAVYEISPIDFDDNRIDLLWDEISNQNNYMISRDGQNLKWKNSHRDYKIVGVLEGETLIGVATYLEKAKENQIQICDLLFKAGFGESVIKEISNYLFSMYGSMDQFQKIVCLATDSLKILLSQAGYEYGDYDFYFGVKLLNPSIPNQVLKSPNWYVSAND